MMEEILEIQFKYLHFTNDETTFEKQTLYSQIICSRLGYTIVSCVPDFCQLNYKLNRGLCISGCVLHLPDTHQI